MLRSNKDGVQTIVKNGHPSGCDAVPVSAEVQPGVRLKTRLDGLGFIEKTKTFVVIELKTTQHTSDEHVKLYKTPCSRTQMANGLDNSEHTSHMLQTFLGARRFPKRFGGLRLKELFSSAQRVRGSSVHCSGEHEKNESFSGEANRKGKHGAVGYPSENQRTGSIFSERPGRDDSNDEEIWKAERAAISSDRCVGTYAAATTGRKIVVAVAAAGQPKAVAAARAGFNKLRPSRRRSSGCRAPHGARPETS